MLQTFAVLALLILTLPVAGSIAYAVLTRSSGREPSLAVYFLAGLSILSSLILAGIPLTLLCPAALVFLPAGILYLVKKRKDLLPPPPDTVLLFACFAVSVPLLFFMLLEPLSAWDARSIWFFHAKMIYYGGALQQNIGLYGPQLPWYHFDYPKLVAGLAATIATGVGYWNEYLPKLSLVFLWIGAVLALADLAHPPRWGKLVLFALLICIKPYHLYNGYMDGWLAVYACIAHVAMISYWLHGKAKDLTIALLLCLILPQLKNEGLLLALVSMTNFFLFRLFFFRSVPRRMTALGQNAGMLGLGIVPFLLWAVRKHQWGLENDLQLLTVSGVRRAITRFADGPLPVLYRGLLRIPHIDLLFLGIALLLLWSACMRGSGRSRQTFLSLALPLSSALLYTLGLSAVYLMTANDFLWQIAFSADRVMLPVIALLLFALYSCLPCFGKER